MYSKIDARIWDDEKILALSPDARYLFVYILTTKHRNVLGCYQLPRSYAAEDTGLSERKFGTAWKELIASGMIDYDYAARVVLVRNFLKYNPIENPNQAKGALLKLDSLPRSPLFSSVCAYLNKQAGQSNKSYLEPVINALLKLIPEGLGEPLDKAITEGLGEPLDKPLTEGLPKPDNSKQITDNSIQYSETDNRKKGEYPPTPPKGGGASLPAPGKQLSAHLEAPKPRRKKPSTLSKFQEARFNRFWAAYPRKLSIGDAEKAWAKINPDDGLTEVILKAIEKAKRCDSRFREARFTPHPATWLNGREWLNEYNGPDGPAPPPRPVTDTLGVLETMLHEGGQAI